MINYKIHPHLQEILSARVAAQESMSHQAPELRVIVMHRPRADTAKAALSVAGVTGAYRQFRRLLPGQAIVATPDAIAVLAQRPDIDMIWYDEPVHIWLDASVPLIGAQAVHNAGISGKGVRVAILDTGIDATHPDFTGRLVQVHDLVGEGPTDLQGHGTHVAGIVGGSGAASHGMYRGVAPECDLLIGKVLHNDGSGSMSDVIAGLEWALEQKAQVINISLGGSGSCDGTDALSTACDAVVEKGIVVCVAAGNDGPAPNTVGSPACAKNVISVGATDKQDRMLSFSSRGPTADGRVKPDLCFPGGEIHSCRARGTSMGQPIDQFYTTASGTSMAAPHATGACALLLQANPGLTPQQVKEALLSTARDIGAEPNAQGHGRAQVFPAYQFVTSVPPTTPPPTETPPPAEEPPPEPAPVPPPNPPGGGCLQLVKTLFGGG